MSKSIRLLLALLVIANALLAQSTFPKYGKPVDIPIYLSATFGEIRPNHIHAGLDIKTQGVEGKKVYAVADGYVSRIGVSPYGYGQVLYITHFDGYTSVYAHLQRFSKEIANYVKDYQYAHKTYTAQIFPPKPFSAPLPQPGLFLSPLLHSSSLVFQPRELFWLSLRLRGPSWLDLLLLF